jgi:hypothetical protein
MNDSILTTIKGLLGIGEDVTGYDKDLIVLINAALATLHQLGVGTVTIFSITGDSQTWGDFLGESGDFEMVKTAIYLRTRLVFDPPQVGYVLDALKAMLKEYEFRLTVQASNILIDATPPSTI